MHYAFRLTPVVYARSVTEIAAAGCIGDHVGVPRKPSKEPRKSLTLRLPVSLLAKVQDAAESDHRSVNSWAISVFEAALREKSKSRT
jgi:predicted HicB family RNase H-like nuclease